MRLLLAAAALALAAPAAAHDAPEWRAVNAETGQIRDLEGLDALARDFPDSGIVRLRMLQPLLEAGEIDRLLETLRWLQERGYVFGAVSQEQIPKLVGEDHAGAARALLIPQARVIEASEVVAELPAEAGLIETVLVAADGDTMLATSITGNAIHTRVRGGDWKAIAISRAGDLSGVVADPSGEMAWVASANLDGSEDEGELFTGLIGLSNGFAVPKYVEAPEGVALSDLSVAGDGTVYASDPLGGGIYRKEPGGGVREFIAPGTFRSPQGSAVSADGRRLYVSDYRYGIALVDTDDASVSRLASDIPVILDGVDGLWRYGNELIAVQNGTSPMRISAFTLSPDGSRVIAARVLEQAHSAWSEPLGGSISGDELVYVATGQWDRYDRGDLREGMDAIPTQIRRLPLDNGGN